MQILHLRGVTWYAIRERVKEVNTLTPLFESTGIKTDR